MSLTGEQRLRDRERIAIAWSLALLLAMGVVAAVRLAGAEWSEAFVQGLVAIGGVLALTYRNRPRVRIRFLHRHALYLEIVNTGNRVAKQVVVNVHPPIDYRSTGRGSVGGREEFGLREGFGDMDRDQRYVVYLGSSAKVPFTKDTVFEVSYKRGWWFGWQSVRVTYGGSGWDFSLGSDRGTAEGDLVQAIQNFDKKMDRMTDAIKVIGDRLRPPLEGGLDIEWKECPSCNWDRFCFIPTSGSSTFRCVNCLSDYEPDCGCEVTWCQHRPAPQQCERTA